MLAQILARRALERFKELIGDWPQLVQVLPTCPGESDRGRERVCVCREEENKDTAPDAPGTQDHDGYS